MDDTNTEALCWMLWGRDGEAEFLANKSQVFLFSKESFRSLDYQYTTVYTHYEGQSYICGGRRLFLKYI